LLIDFLSPAVSSPPPSQPTQPPKSGSEENFSADFLLNTSFIAPPTPVFAENPTPKHDPKPPSSLEPPKLPILNAEPPKPPISNAERPKPPVLNTKPSKPPAGSQEGSIVTHAEYHTSHPVVRAPQVVFTFASAPRLGEPPRRSAVQLRPVNESVSEVTNEIKEEEEFFFEPDDSLQPSALEVQGNDRFGIAEAVRGIVADEPAITSEPEIELSSPTLPDVTETKCYQLYQEYIGGL
jgi:hypothetical protein